MASIYDLDPDYVSEKLVPPELRGPIRLAWLRVLLSALKAKHQNIFGSTNSFSSGLVTDWYDSTTAYSVGDNVRVGIARYECTQAGTGFFPPSNRDYWVKIASDFVGTDARKNFYAGKMSLEYLLNLYLQPASYWTTSGPPIYIATLGSANATLMMGNNVAPFNNWMPNNSVFEQNYMANFSIYYTGFVNFHVFVPTAVYNALASTNLDRTNICRSVVDRFNTAGMTYDIITY